MTQRVLRHDFELFDITLKSNGGLKYKAFATKNGEITKLNDESTRYPMNYLIEPFEGIFKKVLLDYTGLVSFNKLQDSNLLTTSEKKSFSELKRLHDRYLDHKLSLVYVTGLSIKIKNGNQSVRIKGRIMNDSDQGFNITTDFISVSSFRYGFESELSDALSNLEDHMFEYVVMEKGASDSTDILNPINSEIRKQINEHQLLNVDYQISKSISDKCWYIVSDGEMLFKVFHFDNSGYHLSEGDKNWQFSFRDEQYFIVAVNHEPESYHNEYETITDAIQTEFAEHLSEGDLIVEKADDNYFSIQNNGTELYRVIPDDVALLQEDFDYQSRFENYCFFTFAGVDYFLIAMPE